MNAETTNEILNEVLRLHSRSLANYLGDASPWFRGGHDKATQTLAQIVDDQRETVERLGEMILANGGVVYSGEFPMTFTSLHDLSFDYLLGKLIEAQRQLVVRLEGCVDRLRLVPLAKATVEEALGMAKGHLQSLEELAAEQLTSA